jgi:hypothetical protein
MKSLARSVATMLAIACALAVADDCAPKAHGDSRYVAAPNPAIDSTINFQTKIIADSNSTAGTVRATVVDTHTGEAVSSVLVRVIRPDGAQIGFVAANAGGEFQLSGLPPDTVTMQLSRIGYRNETVMIVPTRGLLARIALHPINARIAY